MSPSIKNHSIKVQILVLFIMGFISFSFNAKGQVKAHDTTIYKNPCIIGKDTIYSLIIRVKNGDTTRFTSINNWDPIAPPFGSSGPVFTKDGELKYSPYRQVYEKDELWGSPVWQYLYR